MSTTALTPATTAATGTTAGTAMAPNRYAALTNGPRVTFVRLVRTELRKMVDTRSGRWLIGAILSLAVLALAWDLTHLPSGTVSYADLLNDAHVPVDLILPVIGILAVTSEWTQRTVMTTFTLAPRRIPVMLAKLVAAVLLAAALVAAVTVLALGATALAGVIGGHGVSYAGALRDSVGAGLSDGLAVLMGAGIGLLIPQTAVALLIFFVIPTMWALVGPGLLHAQAAWLDIFNGLDKVSRLDFAGQLPHLAVAMGFWILLPAVVGIWLGNRREVK